MVYAHRVLSGSVPCASTQSLPPVAAVVEVEVEVEVATVKATESDPALAARA